MAEEWERYRAAKAAEYMRHVEALSRRVRSLRMEIEPAAPVDAPEGGLLRSGGRFAELLRGRHTGRGRCSNAS